MTKHFFFKVHTGPTQVQQVANRFRLHLAGSEVLEGTERVWVHIWADNTQAVERRLAGLPTWMHPATINEFR